MDAPDPADLVIQPVHHGEPAAVVHPAQAAAQADQIWADNIVFMTKDFPPQQPTQQPIQQSVQQPVQQPMHTNSETEKVHLLEYNRYPEPFRKALCEGHILAKCRQALEEAGFKWLLPCGAKVFVHPWQYKDALVCVVQLADLRPYHVIVSESLEYNVEVSLQDLSYRQGARVRNRHELGHALLAEPVAAANETPKDDNDAEMPLVERRTFICSAPRLRHPNSVTQSTTEANGGGMNPRRVVAESDASRDI